MIVRMWEVQAHPESLADVLSWVCERAVPAVADDPNLVGTEVFSSLDNRIVVITRWRRDPRELEEPPGYLVTRKPHSWDFSPVEL
ncbi:hypothetical protein AB0I28_31700 [Phytomonospora sp. NPDC050363]|uniref:hypothetical protein n=1 Tax=Phytomonospora sp. NPDC050363 TaxID=3155642 RepID=UPI0033FC430F